MKLSFFYLAACVLGTDVLELGGKDFAKSLSDYDLTLVEFFAPWCGHCKALAPEYEIAATELKDYDGAKIALAKIDCTKEQDLCQDQKIQGYPTLKMFKGDKFVGPYEGTRSADEIAKYMIRRSQPVIKTLTAAAELESLLKNPEEIVAVGLFSDKKSNATFVDVAEAFRDRLSFAQISDKDLATKYGVKEPAVVVLRDGGEAVATTSLEDPTELIKFLNVESFPAFGEIGPNNYVAYTQSGIPLMFAFVEDDEQRDQFKEWLTPLLEEMHSKVNFVFLNTRLFGSHADNLNIEKKFPALAVHDLVSNKKFAHGQEADLSKESVTKWVKEYLTNKLDPKIKSEPIPETQDEPVYHLVAKEYNDIVLDDDRDVLVEFYAPWCGHCKKLSPIYDDLALSFGGTDKVRIAKIDHTLNEVPDEISGYPTIKLYPAGKKSEPVKYTGSRTLDDLIQFIHDEGTHKAVPKAQVDKGSVMDDMDHEEL